MDILSYLLGKKAGGGGGEAVLINKSVTANGTYNASSDSADGYKKVVVDVPNSYSAADEGKVVSNGALVAQGSATYTSNGTYDTTLVDEVEVAVPVSNVSVETGTFTVTSDISVPGNGTPASLNVGFSGQPDFIYVWMDKDSFDNLEAWANNRWWRFWLAKKDSSFATLPPIRQANDVDFQSIYADCNYISAVGSGAYASTDPSNVSGHAVIGIGLNNRNADAFAINNNGTLTIATSSGQNQLVLAATYHYVAITGLSLFPS